MAVPKRKLSRKRRDQRSANKGLDYQGASACQTCQQPISSHQICGECGYYKGRKILRTKTDRLYERNHARQAAALHAQKNQPAAASEGNNPPSEQ